MEKIKNLMKKADDLSTKADLACGAIVIEILKKYKKTRDAEIENSFVEDLGCFSQAGDGLVFTDEVGSNVPVCDIVALIESNGYFTYDDFINSRI
ncbi:hypothetical protein [Chryseobacterium sp. JV274]|jgi:CRISPR/Cas system-associated protein Cas7 (RAMP superfamily)|uniref:hypothetical protein n=1 Tax=Chryseobacterium sp. JV274 TaxID=1932669 RepID=UPI0015C24947|nr:hypothetical protein [Chryseobacterium sp. JV274]CAD0220372.1 conserved protein of unknown function [Chryseobacterium sp. JV274]